MLRIGTAGWAIPRQHAHHFSANGSSLQRYADRFNCTEINSTFHRPHRRATFERWAATVPAGFRFSVKMPKSITHERRLIAVEGLLDSFLADVAALGEKLGPVLVQFPGKLEYQTEIAAHFFEAVRGRTPQPIVCEPRNATWFSEEATAVFMQHQISRVAADPASAVEAATPDGWPYTAYYRLHGSPRMYFSPYEPDAISALAEQANASEAGEVWCVFDNTGSGAAAGDALKLIEEATAAPRA